MTAQTETFPVTSWSLPRLFHRIRANNDRLTAAHEATRQHLALTERDLSDVCLSRDHVVGIPRYQPELPFFMQHNFLERRN
ncbi:hypothetical protein EF888_07205 [Silicimonas algicola]|uniref:Uncharacterized protein n=1 Tax=Silicimonas algicola TaxID=1826607 RepID=A0A316G2U9_9RHOB|nr:hypothetical protein [Silicimonas algicola]AZQ66945.1 hypothetical protein EF888_07205 [Silicimonas algicola]PWK55138.1 hypothetical protein C8D95_10813 [Silicimonas algicola]